MIAWAIAILILDAVLFFELTGCDCMNTASIIVAVGIGIVGLAILIRTLVKIKAGRFEEMKSELKDLRGENKELLEKIASIRERQIMDRTDSDLV